MRELRRWKRLWRRSLTRSHKWTSLGAPISCWNSTASALQPEEITSKGTRVSCVYYQKKCPIRKKSVNLFNDPLIYIYIYNIYIYIYLYIYIYIYIYIIKVWRTRHAGHCCRSRDELISDVLLWTPMAEQKQGEQLEPRYNSSVRIRYVALRTNQKQWTTGWNGKRGSGMSMLVVRQDDLYIYIYIYWSDDCINETVNQQVWMLS